MATDEKPYTTGEVADLSHVTINAVKKWIAAGKLEAYTTPGGHFRIKREDFRDFVKKFNYKVKEGAFLTAKKILIADDEPSVLDFLRESLNLSDNGYLVETACDGYEALIKVGSFEPNVLVIDIRMPRIDGIEVCKRLRADKSTKRIKILAITAYGAEDRQNIIDAGADMCLQKPMDMSTFVGKVQELLG
jgi:excisionase family DNA binding protein